MKNVAMLILMLLVSGNAMAMSKKPANRCVDEKWKCSIAAHVDCAPLFRVFDPNTGMADANGNPMGGWTLDESNPLFQTCKTEKAAACNKKAGC